MNVSLYKCLKYNWKEVFKNFIFANTIAIGSSSRRAKLIGIMMIEVSDSKHCFFLFFLNYGTRTPHQFGEAEGAV
jgi:hypothetical protein